MILPAHPGVEVLRLTWDRDGPRPVGLTVRHYPVVAWTINDTTALPVIPFLQSDGDPLVLVLSLSGPVLQLNENRTSYVREFIDTTTMKASMLEAAQNAWDLCNRLAIGFEGGS
jgi:hypothetical protein